MQAMIRSLVAAVLASISAASFAQSGYPRKPILMVVPLQAEANDLRMNFINPFGRRRAVVQ